MNKTTKPGKSEPFSIPGWPIGEVGTEAVQQFLDRGQTVAKLLVDWNAEFAQLMGHRINQLRRCPTMNESIGRTRTRSPVMPTKVGIHDFAARTNASRGWRAFARHDELGSARVLAGAAIVGRRLSESIGQMAQCRSVPQLLEVEGQWFKRACDDYSNEASKLMEVTGKFFGCFGGSVEQLQPNPSGVMPSPAVTR